MTPDTLFEYGCVTLILLFGVLCVVYWFFEKDK